MSGVTVHHFLATEPLEDFITGEEKIRTPTGRFTPAFYDALLEAADYRCVYCGIEITPDCVQIDHIVPRSRGGSHDLLNLAPVCGWCNAAKGGKTLDHFRLILALRSSPIAGIITPVQAMRLMECGVSLPIDPSYRFYFETQLESLEEAA